MPLRVIAGEFPVVGTQPDGDSARFYPDDPDAWCKTRIRGRVNPSGGVQLRLDAIDAAETHYTPPKGTRRLHQPGEAGPVLAVVVDLDGVLRRWDPGVLARAEAAFRLPAGAVGEVAFAPALLSATVTGRVSDPVWREQVVGRLAGRFGRAAAVGAVARWSASAEEVDPDVLAVVRGLRGDLARLGLAGEVDVVFGTAELGVAKPDPAVFRLVCGRLGVQPGQYGFVDDTPGHVAVARAVGLVGHR